MEYRVEKKYVCTGQQLELLRARLSAVLAPDANLRGRASYLIRSVYFDSWDDDCFRENEAGVDERSKFRLRAYDRDPATARLEIKGKRRGYTRKEQSRLTPALCETLLGGALPPFDRSFEPALRRFWLEASTRFFQPKLIVEYERTAFVLPEGNVRVTFDRNIAASTDVGRFFDAALPVIPVLPTGRHVLEVKYDELLPDYAAQLLELGSLEQSTFSKYYIGRMAVLK